MQEIYITDNFDGGSITQINVSNPENIQLALKQENASKVKQWFYFRLEGNKDQLVKVNILNAGNSSFQYAWKGYRTCYSWDRKKWFRLDTNYTEGVLSFECKLIFNSVYFAYFAPYSYERHMDLLHKSQQDTRVELETLGETLDGNALSLLEIGAQSKQPKHKVWIIARQHSGETMAEWLIEGLLSALLDSRNPLSSTLLATTTFYVVPNMNPDGSKRGNLRCNSAGVDLNREWLAPSMEKSPEVFLVREKMLSTGGSLFLDIHGDEAMPFNFVVGCEGIPQYDEAHKSLETTFKIAFKKISPDFQDRYGYPKARPGKANLGIAANWFGHTFKTLSLTLEMPFKDNANLTNLATGWSPDRCLKLGADVLFPITEVLRVISDAEA